MADSPKVTAALEKHMKGTWMGEYSEKPGLRDWPDDKLASEAKKFPKYTNDMTEDQKAESAAIYRERYRRHLIGKMGDTEQIASQYAELEKKGEWPSGKPFPKAGDEVSAVVPGIFGMPLSVEGVVKRKGDGTYYVSITSQHVAGARTQPLTPAWRIEKPKARSSRAGTVRK